MTRQGWAEKIMNRRMISSYDDIAAALIAEHQRAVRVVKQEIERVKLDQYKFTPTQKMRVEETLDRLLAALQKGRT